MELVRCLRFAPLVAVAAIGISGITGPAAMVAGDPPWEPPPCPAGAGATPTGDAATGAWFRMDPMLDAGGTLASQRLEVGTAAGAARWLLLPPESFASGPVGGLVLTGTDDGRASRLQLVDPARACATVVGREGSVIRSAVLAPRGDAIFEHRVNRTTRADEGVWRRSVSTGRTSRVLRPMPPDVHFGPTFVTDLRTAGGGRLVVASCGQRACRTRVLDPANGHVDRVDGTGPALGVSGGRLIARAACAGLPCPVIARDLDGTGSSVLVATAGAAALGGPGDGLLLYEDGGGGTRTLDLRTGVRAKVARGSLLPVAGGSLATSGADAGPGALVLGPAGRIPDGRHARRLDPHTHAVVEIGAVTP